MAEDNPVLFISLESEDSLSSSSIRVIGKVQVEENGCELTSVLWSHPYETPASYIPVEENGKISFAELAESSRTFWRSFRSFNPFFYRRVPKSKCPKRQAYILDLRVIQYCIFF